MSTARTLAGFAGLAVVAGGWWLAGLGAVWAWVPGLRAPLRQLAVAIVGLVGLLLVGAVLGTVGWFRPWPLVAVSAIAGLAGLTGLRSRPQATGVTRGGEVAGRDRWLLGGAISLVALRWGAELLQTLSRGFSHADELHYHLTHSALFVQSGQTWPIRFTSVGDGAAYHPAHAELLHGVALSVLGSDFASIFVNLGFAAMALAAGWSIGARAGNPAAGSLVVAATLSLPLVVAESGSTLNDTMAIALLLVAVAFLLTAVERTGDPRLVGLAGLAAGAAIGTKLTVAVAVVALTLLARALPAGHRLGAATTYVGSAVVAGGYWYLRNLTATGNPVPALSVGPLPGPELELQRAVEFPVTDYLTDLVVWRDHLLPGLTGFFGLLWPVILGLVVVSVVAAWTPAVRRSSPRWSLLAACGVLSLVGYAVTPTSAAGAPGAPVLFEFNLRYAVPGALLCALAGLGHPALRRRPTLGTALAATAFFAANLHVVHPGRGVAAAVGVASAAGVWWLLLCHPRQRVIVGGLGALVAVTVAGIGLVLHDRYLDRRWTAELPRWAAYEAGDRASGLAVGLTGYPQAYPFFGEGLDNRVVTLGDDRLGDELVPFESCRAWWARVGAERLDVVVVLDERGMAGTELGRWLVEEPERWLRAAGAPALLEAGDATVFDVRSAQPSCGAEPVETVSSSG